MCLHRILVALRLLGCLVLLSLSQVALACSCAPPAAPLPFEIINVDLSAQPVTGTFGGYNSRRKEYRTDVLRGKIIASEDYQDPEDDGPFSRYTKLTFKVNEVLWGEAPRTVEILTPRSGAACGWSAAEGQEAIVFASRRLDEPDAYRHTSLCNRNTTDAGRIDDFTRFFRGFRDKKSGHYSYNHRPLWGKPAHKGVLARYQLDKGGLVGEIELARYYGVPLVKGTFDKTGQRTGTWTHYQDTYTAGERQLRAYRESYSNGVYERREVVVLDSEPLPYAQLEKPREYISAGGILARMSAGLGFRYYWATEGLTATDLDYRPTPEARSTRETIEHLYGLTEVLYSVAVRQASVRPLELDELSFEQLRAKTLLQIEAAEGVFGNLNEEQIRELKIRFMRSGKTSTDEFGYLLNGPLADAIYHTGQVVTLRRAAGNPIPKGVNVYRGVKR